MLQQPSSSARTTWLHNNCYSLSSDSRETQQELVAWPGLVCATVCCCGRADLSVQQGAQQGCMGCHNWLLCIDPTRPGVKREGKTVGHVPLLFGQDTRAWETFSSQLWHTLIAPSHMLTVAMN
jgi:hypothetical protein